MSLPRPAALQDAGGWISPIMPLRYYVEVAKTANQGVVLGDLV
jgi:hypothetical protein